MEIKEFWDIYPNYNMGFTATNPKTATEKIVGLKMHLVYNSTTKRTYQEFSLRERYNTVVAALADGKVHQFEMSINNNSFNVVLVLKKGKVRGICLETGERISFDKGIQICIRA